MDKIWNELYGAAKAVLKPRNVSSIIEAGGVAAAIESASEKSTSAYASTARVRWESARNETRFST